MQMTKFTDFSLRVLIFLATFDKTSSVSEINQKYSISKNHLAKIIHKLAKLKYIKTMQGRGGGISLAMHPCDINIGAVVREMENFHIVECFSFEENCLLSPVCKLKNIFQTASFAFLEILDKYTLADIVYNKKKLLQVFDV